MIEAQEHNSFFFGNKRVKNIKELLETLENPDNFEVSKQYANETKNDFANWIREVLKEESLADKISRENDVQSILSILKKYLEEQSQNPDAAIHSDALSFNIKKYEEEKKEHEKSDSHLKASTEYHKTILKKSTEPRQFCPRFFDCMKKEFLFGMGLGIIVGIVIAIFIKMGAI